MTGRHHPRINPAGRRRARTRRAAALAAAGIAVAAAGALMQEPPPRPAATPIPTASPGVDEGFPPPDWYAADPELAPEGGPGGPARRSFTVRTPPTRTPIPTSGPVAPILPSGARPATPPPATPAPVAPSATPGPAVTPTERPRKKRRCRRHPERPRCTAPSPSPAADPLIQLPPLPNP